MKKTVSALIAGVVALVGIGGVLLYHIIENVDVIAGQDALISQLRTHTGTVERPDPRALTERPAQTPPPAANTMLIEDSRGRALIAREAARSRMLTRAREKAESLKDPSIRARFIESHAVFRRGELAQLPAWVDIPPDKVQQLVELRVQNDVYTTEIRPEMLATSDPWAAEVQAAQDHEAQIARLLGPEPYARWREYHYDTEFGRTQVTMIFEGASEALPEDKFRVLACIISDLYPSRNTLSVKLRRDDSGAISEDPSTAGPLKGFSMEEQRIVDATIREKARTRLSTSEFEVLDDYLREKMERWEASARRSALKKRLFGDGSP